ncbi:MAG: glycosyltransferase [Ardenticatenaceae bacterium]|nr:glycosyltransferase [Ardenticatenaceae bacterium]
MKVSVIIPSLNSPILDSVIEKIIQQPQYEAVGEILIVGKDDQHLLKTVDAPKVQLIETPKPVNAAKARNIGIQHAKHELLLFLDSDCLPEPTWLDEHLRLQAQGHPVVGGGVLPEGTNYWSLSYNLTLFHEFFSTNAEGEKRYLPTLNLSVQKKVIDEVGLLNEELSRGQDIEWTTRMKEAGFMPYFAPQAVILHQHSRLDFTAVWQDCARSGYHMRQVRIQYPQLFKGSRLLQNRLFLLLLSPFIATAITTGIVRKHLSVFHKSWHTIPAIYFTKIAWCWGASGIDMAVRK